MKYSYCVQEFFLLPRKVKGRWYWGHVIAFYLTHEDDAYYFPMLPEGVLIGENAILVHVMTLDEVIEDVREKFNKLSKKHTMVLDEVHYHFGCDPECVGIRHGYLSDLPFIIKENY